LATNLPSPKCLADLFEAVAGAIYFHSGRCLYPVQNSYLPMVQYAFGKYFYELWVNNLENTMI
jgi:dsRNA-specific ribonuclease